MVKVKFKNTCKSKDAVYIETWKKHVSTKQLLKFIPKEKTRLFELLKESHEGILCLKYFKKILSTHGSRDHILFTGTIEQLGKHLERHPTLIPFLPLPLVHNVKRIRKSSIQRDINIICLTKHHALNCAGCDTAVIGNKCKSLACACSIRFYHASCYKKVALKCSVCSSVFTK